MLLRFIRSDGAPIPSHAHITEVGHVTRRFIDCGGLMHEPVHTCLLQTWMSDSDPDHRLTGETFGKILSLGKQVLPQADLEVEIEYEADGMVTQAPVIGAAGAGPELHIQLGSKHTHCLARERRETERTVAGEICRPREQAACCC